MTHTVRVVAVAAVLAAFVLCVPTQAQTPELDALRARAEQGNAEAQFNLGVAYIRGRGVSVDAAEAARWFRLSAESGLAEARFMLGTVYVSGAGVAQDVAEGIRWIALAASQGLTAAQYDLGKRYENGIGVPQDDTGLPSIQLLPPETYNHSVGSDLIVLTLRADLLAAEIGRGSCRYRCRAFCRCGGFSKPKVQT